MVKKFKDIFYIKFLFIWICKAKNANPDKYKFSDYSIGFDSRSEFSFTDGSIISSKNIDTEMLIFLELI